MAARKPVAPKPVASNVIVLDSPEIIKALAEREDLFSIDGKTYSMFKNPSANITMKVIDKFQESGIPAGAELALQEMLGLEAYEALMECKTLTQANLTKITEIVVERVVAGTALDPKANSNEESPNS